MGTSDIPAGPRGFVESDDEQIYFEMWGSGEAVVLSHGMGGNHVVWYQQVPFLAARYRVITWDQRGFGRSTNRTSRPGPESSVVDLTRVLDHLEVEHAHLIGQSMGGWSALGFALAHPDRASSLVLADSTGGIFTPEIRAAFNDYAEVIAASPPPDQLPMGSHPALGSQPADENLAQSFLYSEIGGMASPPSSTLITELLGATDNTARLERLRAPTLFVAGEDDPIFPPYLIEQAAALIPGSETKIVSGSGHSPYFERAQIWNGIVLEFLQRSIGTQE